MNTEFKAENTNPNSQGPAYNQLNSGPTDQARQNQSWFDGNGLRLGWFVSLFMATLLVFCTLIAGTNAQTLPEISISSNVTSVAEDTAVTFQLSSSAATSVTVNVEVTQVGEFFNTSAVGTKMVTFSNAQTASLTIPAPATADTTYEADGSLTATIQDGSTYTIDSDDGEASVIITDNEATPAGISIIKLQSSIYEGEDARFRVAADSISVDSFYVRVNVTQTGSFFRFSNVKQQTVRFQTGQLTHDIAIGTYDDETVESDGSITATIMAPSGSEYTRATNYTSASVTIKDNEPELSISTTQTSVEEGNPIQFTITASIVPTIPIAIRIGVTQTGRFLESSDEEQVIMMNSGSNTQVFELITINDQGDEVDGSATITLATGIGYSIATAPNNSFSVSITDNDPLPSISVSTAKSVLLEDESLTVTFKASRPVTQNLRVYYAFTEKMTNIPNPTNETSITILAGDTEASYFEGGNTNTRDGSNVYFHFKILPDRSSGEAKYMVENSPNDTIEVEIQDDDVDTTNFQVTISSNQSSIIEGEEVNFSILSNKVADLRRNIYYRVESTGNFISESRDQIFSIGATHELRANVGERNWSLSIPTINDEIQEDDGKLTITIIDSHLYHTTEDDSVTINIKDNDSDQTNLPTISISASNLMITEGDEISLTISSDRVLTKEIEVDIQLENGPKAPGNIYEPDFIFGSSQITTTLDQNNQSRVITVLTSDDNLYELDGFIDISISPDRSLESQYRLAQSPDNEVRINIMDNDKPELSVIPITKSIIEGELATFRISSDKTISSNFFTVFMRVQNGSGNFIDESIAINYDIRSPFNRVNIPYGSARVEISVGTLNDKIDEVNGSIELILEPPSSDYYSIATNYRKATVEVIDNDETPVISILNPSNEVFLDDGDSQSIMIQSSIPRVTDLDVNLSVSLSGAAATNITRRIIANSSSVVVDSYTLSSSQTSVDLTVLPSPNYIVASVPNNSINLVLKSSTKPGISIKPVTSIVNEGELAQFTIESTDTITNNPLSVTVEFRDENDAIIQINNQNSVIWQIPTSQRSTTQSVPNGIDSNESSNGSITAKILASSTNSYTISKNTSTAQIQILDVNGNTEFSISNLDDSITEGETAKFRISREKGPIPSESLNIEARLAYSGDYFGTNLSTQKIVTWPPNNSSNYIEFEIETFNDDIGENSGQISATLIKNLSYTVKPNNNAVVKIIDNDLPTVTAHYEDEIQSRGLLRTNSAFSFIVRASKPTDTDLSVNISLNESRNYLETSPNSVTIPAGKIQTLLTLRTRLITDVSEIESYVLLEIERGSNYVVGHQSQASVVVRNRFGIPQGTGPIISLSSNFNQITEGESVHIFLNANSTQSSTLPILTTFSTPVEIDLYDTQSHVEFVNLASNTQTVSYRFQTIDDYIDEPDRNLIVSIINIGTYRLGEVSSLNLKILDNDEPEISIYNIGESFIEDNDITFTLESTTVLDSGLLVNVDIAELGNTNNFYSGASTRRIPIEAGTDRTQFTVNIDGDTQDEDDTLLTAEIASGQNYRIGDESRVIIEVKDNDLNEISLSTDNDFVLEGDMITLNLSSTTIPDTELMVNVNISETSSGTNYYSGATTRQIPISVTQNSAQFMVNTDENNVTGNDGEITISLAPESTNYQLGTSSSVTITVVDDDENRISISSMTDSVTEGDMIEFRFTATSASASMLNVNVAIAEVDGGGDFYSGNATRIVNLPANDTMVSFMVNTDSDNLDEENEAITVTVQDGTGYKPNPVGKSVLVMDDDETPVMSLTNATFEVDEDITGGNLLVNVSLSIPAITQVDYTYTLSGGTAISGTDYTLPSPLTGSIAVGDQTDTITIPITPDDRNEGNETFDLAISITTPPGTVSAVFADGTTSHSQTITIVDDEDPEIEFDPAAVEVNENVSSGFVEVTANLSGPTNNPVSIVYETVNGNCDLLRRFRWYNFGSSSDPIYRGR